MATVQVEEVLKGTQKKLDIVNFVNYDTWKDLLIELVQREKLDPWNIDIAEIVDSYVNAVKELKVMDLRLPANIILAASILLRLKSDLLPLSGEAEPVQEEMINGGRSPPLVEELSFRLRPPVKRRLTLQELIDALDEAMKMKEVRSMMSREREFDVPIVINDVNIEQEMETVYKEIKKNSDKEGMITFSSLLGVSKSEDVLLELFIPILFLANKEKITLMQERFFEEIIIRLN